MRDRNVLHFLCEPELWEPCCVIPHPSPACDCLILLPMRQEKESTQSPAYTGHLGGKRQHTVHRVSLFHTPGIPCSCHTPAGQTLRSPKGKGTREATKLIASAFTAVVDQTCWTILIVLVLRTKCLPHWIAKVQSPVQKSCTERCSHAGISPAKHEHLCSQHL